MARLMGHQARTNDALDRILFASRTGQGPFAAYRLPQECRNYPSNLESPFDQANFLFVVLLHMSGGNPAEASFRGHRRLYERWPKIYDSKTAINYTADEIREMMKAVGLQFWNTRPEWLLHNARVLNKYWDGDPRNIFGDTLQYKNELEIWQKLQGRVLRSPRKLLGFQEKMLSLLVHFLVDARLVDPCDVPPPIDVHQNRFFGSLGLVTQGNVVRSWKELNAFRDRIRQLYIDYAHSRNVSMLEIGEAVWFYSAEMCKYAPGAYTINGQHVGISSLTNESGKRKFQGKYKVYSQTCGNCIVSDLCKRNMPHVFHYNGSGGLIFVSRPRISGEKPLVLDMSASETLRCTRHQGKLWSANPNDGCIGCGECGRPLDLPVRLQTTSENVATARKLTHAP